MARVLDEEVHLEVVAMRGRRTWYWRSPPGFGGRPAPLEGPTFGGPRAIYDARNDAVRAAGGALDQADRLWQSMKVAGWELLPVYVPDHAARP